MKGLYNIAAFLLILILSIFASMGAENIWIKYFLINNAFGGVLAIVLPFKLILWIPSILVSFLLGLVIYLVVFSRKPIYWSIIFGLCFSVAGLYIIRFQYKTIADYIRHNLWFIIPPISSFLGGIVGVWLRNNLKKHST